MYLRERERERERERGGGGRERKRQIAKRERDIEKDIIKNFPT